MGSINFMTFFANCPLTTRATANLLLRLRVLRLRVSRLIEHELRQIQHDGFAGFDANSAQRIRVLSRIEKTFVKLFYIFFRDITSFHSPLQNSYRKFQHQMFLEFRRIVKPQLVNRKSRKTSKLHFHSLQKI